MEEMRGRRGRACASTTRQLEQGANVPGNSQRWPNAAQRRTQHEMALKPPREVVSECAGAVTGATALTC
jgi:hypothetical protein